MDHTIHPELLRGSVRIMVVGCGGNGSAIAAGLPYLHQALLAYGHPAGLHVTLVDGDLISATNCVRQPFCRSEIGLHKSTVLVNRMNLFWGLEWEEFQSTCHPGRVLKRPKWLSAAWIRQLREALSGTGPWATAEWITGSISAINQTVDNLCLANR